MCDTPFVVRRDEVNISVPCGKCEKCTKRRISGWSFRLIQQDKIAQTSYFITLTYDPKKVPITRNGFMVLDKKHLQNFFKRLRKSHEGLPIRDRNDPIKYYAVGEYGGKSYRPHYHIILFNSKLELIQEAWNMGQVHYGDVTGASVGYTMKYISKPRRIPMHINDDRIPEFALMSKGLGSNYLKKKTSNGTKRIY